MVRRLMRLRFQGFSIAHLARILRLGYWQGFLALLLFIHLAMGRNRLMPYWCFSASRSGK